MGVFAGAAVLVAYAGWSSLYRRAKVKTPDLWPTKITDTARIAGLTRAYGPENAPYVLRLISDFRCPACAAAETTVVRTAKSLADAKILQLVVHDLPGSGNAVGALVAATCASTIDASKYWLYRVVLFASRDGWIKTYPPEPALFRMANSLGIDSVALKRCVETQGSRIATNGNELAKTVANGGINYTPAWSLQDSVFVTEEIANRLRILQGMR